MHVAAALRVAFPCNSSLSFMGEGGEEDGRGRGGREEGKEGEEGKGVGRVSGRGRRGGEGRE